MTVCARCRHANEEGANFCSACGERLDDGSDATQAHEAVDTGGAEVAVPTAPGTAMLVVTRGPNAGSRFVVGAGETTIGRHPDSEIFLDDITVSRHHARLTGDGERFELVDEGSLNGTYLNRDRIETASLGNGDEIQIGRFKLVFLPGDPG